ncbi:MAG: hypothetical protein QOG14_4879 [Mycobacterium sp.]|jgi:hypothetical protein|nr:hypothetical protein [Mycobacterium sp.]
MSTTRLETDYLVIGAGAMGLAFVDVILAEHRTARIVIVDRHASPGGHWNDAYPFVRLHQPAAFYGLNSTNLGRGGEDLVCGPEIVAYFRTAMDRFLATGRVQYLPMSEYQGDGRILSMVEDGRVTQVTVLRRIVDGTYMKVEVPSVVAPRYEVDLDVTFVPPNGLPQVKRPWERYVVLGAGKTGIDAILFLLDQGVSPDRIQWVVSNDAWLWQRATVQPGGVLKTITAFVESVASATNIDEVFLRLERQGIVARVDTAILPMKWRCATVGRSELAGLRQIKDVVRMGRVQRVSRGRMQLDRGTVEAVEDTLFVDCSSNGLAKSTPLPVFADGRIVLQSVFMCQQTFSAALIAHLDLMGLSDEKRNEICVAVPHPERKEDLLAALITSTLNVIKWNRHLPLWLRRSRLNLGHEDPAHHYLRAAVKMTLLYRRAAAAMDRMLAPTG